MLGLVRLVFCVHAKPREVQGLEADLNKLMVLHDEIAALKSYWMAHKNMPPERHASKCHLVSAQVV